MSDIPDDRQLKVPGRGAPADATTSDREAAASLMRQQIDQIYDQSTQTAAAAQPTPEPHDPYRRTHDEQAAHAHTAEQWKRYHSAWQSYYQQYYERYYAARAPQPAAQRPQVSEAPRHLGAAATSLEVSSEPQIISSGQATNELRSAIIDNVKRHLTSAKGSRHFIPLISAVVVMLLFSFVQYNRLVLASVKSYVSPGTISPQNIILDPNDTTKVGPDPKVIIPKINVEAPVVYGVGSLADGPVQNALRDGVVHYPIPGADSVPGQAGNTVVLGHSSNDVFDNGAYKFVFVQLDRLEKGDTFYMNYQGTRYTYSVTGKAVIEPNQVSSLVVSHDKPLATLVTCTPPGTALKRLVVFGEQISPDPTRASAAPSDQESSKPSSLPGNSPTLFERLFGG